MAPQGPGTVQKAPRLPARQASRGWKNAGEAPREALRVLGKGPSGSKQQHTVANSSN